MWESIPQAQNLLLEQYHHCFSKAMKHKMKSSNQYLYNSPVLKLCCDSAPEDLPGVGKPGVRQEMGRYCGAPKQRNMEGCIISNLAASDCWTEAEEVCKKDLGDGPLPIKLLCGPQIRGMPGSQRRHHWPRKRMKNMSTGQRQDSTEPGRSWIPILVSPLASLMLFASSRMTMKLGFFLVMWDW